MCSVRIVQTITKKRTTVAENVLNSQIQFFFVQVKIFKVFKEIFKEY